MNNRGTVTVLSGVLAIPIILSVGLALDLSQLWLLRQRMQWSVDTAALLGASQSNGETGDLVKKDAKELFWASYGAPFTNSNSGTQIGFLGSSSAGATVTPATAAVAATSTTPAVPSNPYVTVTASATLPTTIMRMIGNNLSIVTTTSVAAVPHNVEMTLVLDNSLSMGLAINGASSKLAALQTAANNLLATIFGSGAPSPNVYMGIVPFAGAVNVGNNAIGQGFLKAGTLAAKFPSSSNPDFAWRGCVQARAYTDPAPSFDSTEDSPSSDLTKFDPYYSPSTFQVMVDPNTGRFYRGDNDWTSIKINDTSTSSEQSNTNYLSPNKLQFGPNLFCPHSSLVKITNNRSALNTSINNMVIVNGGGTVMNQGLQWGWFTLSPLWTTWNLPPTTTGAARPAAYTDNGTIKIIVLMTDGVNQVDGIDTFYGAAAVQYADQHSNCDARSDIYPECVQPDSWYNSYGRVSSGVLQQMPASGTNGDALRNDAQVTLRTRFQTLCSNIKAKKVVLYTIFFHGTQDDQILHATTNGAGPDLRDCATDIDHYFDSQSATAINAAFQQIAQDINNLKIKQ